LEGGSKNGGSTGDPFGDLFRRFHRPVVNFFRRRGFPLDECRDLAQETFCRACQGWKDFQGECRVETWLFKIATHVAINALRHKRADKRTGEELSFEEALENGLPVMGRDQFLEGRGQDPDALETLLRKERTQKLREAIEELPPRMRECVLFRLNHGLKYKEIAVLTGVSIDTVKAQLFQARRQLQQRLAKYLTELDLDALGGEEDD